MKTGSGLIAKYLRWFVPPTSFFQSLLLLVIRLYWGWEFFLTGKGKLMDLERPTEYFQSLGIPLPHLQAILVGATECFGGLLLLAGLCSRLISLPLTILLTIAYLAADFDKVKMIFSDPDKFLTADQFLFLFAVVIVFAFGPGKFSIDWVINRQVAATSAESV